MKCCSLGCRWPACWNNNDKWSIKQQAMIHACRLEYNIIGKYLYFSVQFIPLVYLAIFFIKHQCFATVPMLVVTLLCLYICYHGIRSVILVMVAWCFYKPSKSFKLQKHVLDEFKWMSGHHNSLATSRFVKKLIQANFGEYQSFALLDLCDWNLQASNAWDPLANGQ